jgi:alpha-pyrone synthase
MHTVLESIGTANPPFKRSQSESAHFMAQIESFSAPIRNRIESIYRHSGIDQRYSCIEDYGLNPERFEFYPKNWSLQPFPTTEARNQTYRDCAGAIAGSAAQQALWQAGREAAEITHLIVVSCTGFSAPGVDIQLVQTLGLASTVDRTLIGFMGCHAAFNGQRGLHLRAIGELGCSALGDRDWSMGRVNGLEPRLESCPRKIPARGRNDLRRRRSPTD